MGSMAEPGVVMVGWPLSMFDMRVKMALAEKRIDYEYLPEDLPTKSPLLLEHNPHHKLIPVLIHNGKPICESRIILEYIDATWKDKAPLLPSDPYLRSQAAFWGDYIDKKIYLGSRKIWDSKGEEIQKAAQEFLGYLRVLEGELGEKPYFMGESFGYVDICLMSYYHHFYPSEILGNFNVEKDCPKLFAWAKRCLERESVSKNPIDPNEIYVAIMTARKLAGLED
ncbi:hypothetical protein L1887_04337 [Cichorium endivia]|nr:hypothetical protein L1887_04337 [Cichorium endivia]